MPFIEIYFSNAGSFCNKLSIFESLTLCYSGNDKDLCYDFQVCGYRLQTEVEWVFTTSGRTFCNNNILRNQRPQ